MLSEVRLYYLRSITVLRLRDDLALPRHRIQRNWASGSCNRRCMYRLAESEKSDRYSVFNLARRVYNPPGRYPVVQPALYLPPRKLIRPNARTCKNRKRWETKPGSGNALHHKFAIIQSSLWDRRECKQCLRKRNIRSYGLPTK